MNHIAPKPIAGPGIYRTDYATYRTAPGISKSSLDLIHDAPALLEWSQRAPVDPDAETAVSIGTAFHTLLLEPDMFGQQYTATFTAPKGALLTVDDLKQALTERGIEFKAGASKQALIKTLLDADPNAPVADAMAQEWEKGVNGRIVLSATDWRKLHLMRGSVMAHPTAAKLMKARGEVEESHFWTDAATGELCKARFDKRVPSFGVLLDVKTTAEIDRFQRSALDYRYHVQDAFYSDGYAASLGEAPEAFLFLLVSTTRDRGRFPVRIKQLGEVDRAAGRAEYRADLSIYAGCQASGKWSGIEAASLPDWYLTKSAGILNERTAA